MSKKEKGYEFDERTFRLKNYCYRDIDLLANDKVICFINTPNGGKYYSNPFMQYEIEPNDTILDMFNETTFCKKRETDCIHGGWEFERRDFEFCDKCKNRVAYNIEEYKSRKYENVDKFKNCFKKREPKSLDEILVEEDRQNLTYNQYLKTYYWKCFREQAIEHYENKCSWCGASGDETSMSVHHIRYGVWFDEDINNVVLLCRDCHSKAHGKVGD